jgi:hypothetical protein
VAIGQLLYECDEFAYRAASEPALCGFAISSPKHEAQIATGIAGVTYRLRGMVAGEVETYSAFHEPRTRDQAPISSDEETTKCSGLSCSSS